MGNSGTICLRTQMDPLSLAPTSVKSLAYATSGGLRIFLCELGKMNTANKSIKSHSKLRYVFIYTNIFKLRLTVLSHTLNSTCSRSAHALKQAFERN